MALATLDLAPLDLRGARAAALTRNYTSFNPTLLRDDHRLLLFFRVANVHFCDGHDPPRDSWKDSVRAETHVRSLIGASELDPLTLRPLRPAALLPASSLFSLDGQRCAGRIPVGDGAAGTFSGAEDPRAFWSPGGAPRAPWLIVSAWSADCSRLGVHLVKLPPSPLEVAAAEEEEAAAAAGASQVELVVASWPAGYTVAPPSLQPLQKNWSPFVHEGAMLLEYSIEPRVLLHADPATGRCTPLYAQTSHAALAAVQARLGRVSGGAPPLLLRGAGVYLGLAHAKASRAMPQATGTRWMEYRHLWYAFAAAPPFAVVAAGAPFALPQQARAAGAAAGGGQGPGVTVQFAAGLALDAAGAQLLVSYSVLDCSVHVASFPLASVLEELGLG